MHEKGDVAPTSLQEEAHSVCHVKLAGAAVRQAARRTFQSPSASFSSPASFLAVGRRPYLLPRCFKIECLALEFGFVFPCVPHAHRSRASAMSATVVRDLVSFQKPSHRIKRPCYGPAPATSLIPPLATTQVASPAGQGPVCFI